MNVAIRETIGVAESCGLSVECLPDVSQYRLLIARKRCQVIRCRAVSAEVRGTLRTFIALFVPRSTWAEFLILFVTADENAVSNRFYVLPRSKLKKRTMLSTSSWVREYANGWHFLLPDVGLSQQKLRGDKTFSALYDLQREPEDLRVSLK